MLVDSHAHLDFNKLSSNFSKIIENAIENNISSILSINTKLKDFENLYKLVKKYNSIWCSVGEHPCNIDKNNIPTKEKILSYINEKVIGIGETGIDLNYSSKNIEYQFQSFKNHIDASLDSNLPLIIHLRKSENELMNFLINENKKNKLKVVMHCFTGSLNLLKKCLDNDFYISLSGIITFKNAIDLQNIVKNIPFDKLLVETDSPFLPPVPFRGRINEPAYLHHTVLFLSSLLNIDYKELSQKTSNNFYNIFTKANKYERIIYES